MADDLSVRYRDLLAGSHDCVDRIVLNAFFPFGCSPGGFRSWWRALHGGSDADLDDTRLMRMAARFSRRLRAWDASAGVPVIYCKPGERKHLIVRTARAADLSGSACPGSRTRPLGPSAAGYPVPWPAAVMTGPGSGQARGSARRGSRRGAPPLIGGP